MVCIFFPFQMFFNCLRHVFNVFVAFGRVALRFFLFPFFIPLCVVGWFASWGMRGVGVDLSRIFSWFFRKPLKS